MKNNKNIIITGSTRGLGLVHAKYLSKSGYNIALVDISRNACSVYKEAESTDSILNELNNYNISKFYECDLTDLKKTKKTFKTILNDFGSIYGAVLNAGGDIKGRDKDAKGGKANNNSIMIEIDDHDSIFDRNYRTCLNSIKAIIPILIKQNYGKIITTSSVSAGYGAKKETTYSTAKAAVMQLSRSAAVEFRDHNICINCIAPGATLTGRFKETIKNRTKEDIEKIKGGGSFLTKIANPLYISFLVEFLLSKKSDYISGQVIRVDGGQFASPI